MTTTAPPAVRTLTAAHAPAGAVCKCGRPALYVLRDRHPFKGGTKLASYYRCGGCWRFMIERVARVRRGRRPEAVDVSRLPDDAAAGVLAALSAA